MPASAAPASENVGWRSGIDEDGEWPTKQKAYRSFRKLPKTEEEMKDLKKMKEEKDL